MLTQPDTTLTADAFLTFIIVALFAGFAVLAYFAEKYDKRSRTSP